MGEGPAESDRDELVQWMGSAVLRQFIAVTGKVLLNFPKKERKKKQRNFEREALFF